MTREEQIEFVRSLSFNVAENIVASIRRGDVPENWDGHEFRLLLADKHSEWDVTDARRKRAYRNEMRVRNI